MFDRERPFKHIKIGHLTNWIRTKVRHARDSNRQTRLNVGLDGGTLDGVANGPAARAALVGRIGITYKRLIHTWYDNRPE